MMRLHPMYHHTHLISDERSRHVKDRNTLVEKAFLRSSSRLRAKANALPGPEVFHPVTPSSICSVIWEFVGIWVDDAGAEDLDNVQPK